jgi:group I intron endonuclease
LNFDLINLKPLSVKILFALYGKDHIKTEELANNIFEQVRACDAAVTKSLVRYGFVIRQHKLTKLMKKEYSYLVITQEGREFVKHLLLSPAKNQKMGIYKITSPSSNVYIGQAINCCEKWQIHIQDAFNLNSIKYEHPLHKAMRKYGVENFSFEIIQIIEDQDELNEAEVNWILEYNSHKDGYNEPDIEKVVSFDKVSEDNYCSKFTEAQIIDIRTRWAARRETTAEIYQTYKDEFSRISVQNIYLYKARPHILPELNTSENREWHGKRLRGLFEKREECAQVFLTETDVVNIRIAKFLGKTRKDILAQYSDISPSAIDRVLYYKSWQHITQEMIQQKILEKIN